MSLAWELGFTSGLRTLCFSNPEISDLREGLKCQSYEAYFPTYYFYAQEIVNCLTHEMFLNNLLSL